MLGPATGLRVLVVDDNHLIRRLLVMILEAAGFEGIEAESAEDALAHATGAPPDLWLVDEVMPGMTGSELVRRLRRSLDRRISCAPMVGISGRTGASSDLLAAGCDAFVAKPVDERRVIDALRRAVRARRLATSDHVPAA
jgi:CheY-like chemotaxis protein